MKYLRVFLDCVYIDPVEREILKIQRIKEITVRARAISSLDVLSLGEGVLSGKGG